MHQSLFRNSACMVIRIGPAYIDFRSYIGYGARACIIFIELTRVEEAFVIAVSDQTAGRFMRGVKTLCVRSVIFHAGRRIQACRPIYANASEISSWLLGFYVYVTATVANGTKIACKARILFSDWPVPILHT